MGGSPQGGEAGGHPGKNGQCGILMICGTVSVIGISKTSMTICLLSPVSCLRFGKML